MPGLPANRFGEPWATLQGFLAASAAWSGTKSQSAVDAERRRLGAHSQSTCAGSTLQEQLMQTESVPWSCSCRTPLYSLERSRSTYLAKNSSTQRDCTLANCRWLLLPGPRQSCHACAAPLAFRLQRKRLQISPPAAAAVNISMWKRHQAKAARNATTTAAWKSEGALSGCKAKVPYTIPSRVLDLGFLFKGSKPYTTNPKPLNDCSVA